MWWNFVGDVMMEKDYNVITLISKYLDLKKAYNHFHNIFRLFDVLLNFYLINSETTRDYYL